MVVLVVFSLAATKQINYILPALPFWAILAGENLEHIKITGEGTIDGQGDAFRDDRLLIAAIPDSVFRGFEL